MCVYAHVCNRDGEDIHTITKLMNSFTTHTTSCRDCSKNSNSLLIAQWPHPDKCYESVLATFSRKTNNETLFMLKPLHYSQA